MSFEGYTQNFCENGHYYQNGNVYDGFDECPFCGCSPVISNLVDDTNCDQHGIISTDAVRRFVITPETTETCNLGHVHMTGPAIHRIPTQEELDLIRQYWDLEDLEYRYCSGLRSPK